MPQASDELRDLMRQRFASERHELDPITVVDCGEVEEWLVKQGWQSSRNGLVRSPKPIGKVPREEFEAMLYLVHEWDYAYAGEITHVAPSDPISDVGTKTNTNPHEAKSP